MNCELHIVCEPHTIRQSRLCDGEHAVHRDMTDLVLYYCNCGYSSSWQKLEDMGPPADFIKDHLPPGVVWPEFQKEWAE